MTRPAGGRTAAVAPAGKPAVGWLHRLSPAARVATPEAVGDALVALHATDPASVHLAVAARTAGPGATVAEVDRALYDDRSLVKVMGMRRTMWAVPAGLVPVVAAACGRAIAAVERRRLVAAIEDKGVAPDGERLVSELVDKATAALGELGDVRTEDLVTAVPALKTTVRFGGTSKWAVDTSLAARVLILLTCDGRIVRTRPTGSWTATRNRYALAPTAGEPLDTAEAQAELARRWMAAFGPLSDDPVGDLKWWAGWTVAATKAALATAGEVEPEPPPGAQEGCAALVPSLDPTTMGWKARDWYLGDLGPLLFDRNANAGPTIWLDGRIVGGWSQRPTGEVVTRLLVEAGRDGIDAIEGEAARLEAWLRASGAVVRPRFPTPVQKELLA